MTPDWINGFATGLMIGGTTMAVVILYATWRATR